MQVNTWSVTQVWLTRCGRVTHNLYYVNPYFGNTGKFLFFTHHNSLVVVYFVVISKSGIIFWVISVVYVVVLHFSILYFVLWFQCRHCVISSPVISILYFCYHVVTIVNKFVWTWTWKGGIVFTGGKCNQRKWKGLIHKFAF